MAFVAFSQTLGGALFATFANIIFGHSLLSGLEKYAPTVDAEAIVNAGATAIRDIVKPAELPGVLEAYSKALNHDFYLAAGAAVASFVFAWGMGWKKVAQKKKPATDAA
jgi:hypothetical protein